MNTSCTKVKQRDSPNDVFLTPPGLVKTAIQMVMDSVSPTAPSSWLDPCYGTGNYYSQFPSTVVKDYCEITQGKDFFEYTKHADIICSNPPYSLLDRWLAHSVSLEPYIINYLIGINNLTAKRVEFMNNAGYSLTKVHMTKVFDWFAMSVIVQFEMGEEIKNCITFDRIVWRSKKISCPTLL